MSNIDKHQIRADIDRRKAIPDFGIGPDPNIARLKVIQETERSFGLEVVEALLDELEAKDRRIAELEAIAKSVKFDPIPMEDLGNKSDGKKHPYMFGAGYNSAVVHCESVLLQAFAAAAGKGEAS